VCAVTGCENSRDITTWWPNNKEHFTNAGLKFADGLSCCSLNDATDPDIAKILEKKNELSKTKLINLIQTNIANELIPSPYKSMMDSTSSSLKYIAKMLKWGRTPTPAEIYSCAKCNTKLTNEENNVHREKGFTVDGKPGLMFNDMENVKAGEKEKQNFQTGKYNVARIICKKLQGIRGK